jgi:hypothetical protein
MPYWVFIDKGEREPVRSFPTASAAWRYIRGQRDDWTRVGYPAPVYRVFCGADEICEHEVIRSLCQHGCSALA